MESRETPLLSSNPYSDMCADYLESKKACLMQAFITIVLTNVKGHPPLMFRPLPEVQIDRTP